jgi:KAP family P-loop domain
LATALDRSAKTPAQKIGDVLRKYAGAVGMFSVKVNDMELSAGEGLEKLGDKLSLSTLEDQRERIAGFLRAAEKRVVVFLDDIDRLDRKEIQSVFKLIKLMADFPHVSYVLAFDRDVVAKAISEQYGAGDIQSGYQYLQKIIQVNLSLPLADREALQQYCLDMINDAISIAETPLTAEQEMEFLLAFQEDIAPDIRTPRLAKLYANSVVFILPLLANEVNPVDLLLLEAIRSLHPAVHEDIRKSPRIYTGDYGTYVSGLMDREKRAQMQLTELLKKGSGAETNRVHDLLARLFPQLTGLLSSGKYGDLDGERAQREQRVSALDYLDRYLTCSIPAGDISDKEIKDYLHQIPNLDDHQVDEGYRRLIRTGQEKTLISKLGTHLDEIPTEHGKRVSMAIVQNGALLPDPPGDWPRLLATAGLVVRRLLRLLTIERKEFAKQVIERAVPLYFAGTCFSWMVQKPNDLGADRLFPSNDEQELRSVLAERIAVHAETAALISGRIADFGPLLWAWQEARGSEPVQRHLRRLLAADATIVKDFLDLFRTAARCPGVDEETYNAIKKFADPKDLMAAFVACGLLGGPGIEYPAAMAQAFAKFDAEFRASHPAAPAP